MAYADKIFKEMCRDIIDNGTSSEGAKVRGVWDDGNPAHTIKRFGVVNRYDLSKEFPIMTLRKTNWKASLEEMLWIFQRQSNNIKDLNSKIWDLWADESGSIGKAYGYQLQTEPSKRIVEVEQKLFEYHGDLKPIKVAELKESNPDCRHKHCGDIIETTFNGSIKILDILTGEDSRYTGGKNASTEAIVQFLDTGNIKSAKLYAVLEGNVKDECRRSVYGVGYLGLDYPKKRDAYTQMMYDKWTRMLDRCYNPESSMYHYYGGRGIFVSSEWHSFSNYLYDTKRLPQYHLAKRDSYKNWKIDKDYYLSNCYHKDACVWVTSSDNTAYACGKPFYLYSKDSSDGELFINADDAMAKHGIYSTHIREVLRGNKKSLSRGFKVEYLKDNGKIYRYNLASNQVDDVLYALKHDRNSRRIMTNFWNPKDAPEKALMECAYSLTFNVVGNKLNVILNQRSNDVLVANNWNVVGYALLTHMLAQVSNLVVGELIHVISDAHLYTKHIELTEELITREEYPAPTLWIDPTITDFYDFKPEHFQLHNYKTGEQIKGIPIAI